MSKYTTEVRYICESYAGLSESTEVTNVNKVIETACPRVFDFEFPIFDENYRLVLEKKILKHYYTREIGFETVGLWKLKLDARLNEIMPYYNKLYESETYKFNPLYDVDYTREHKGSGDTKSDTTGNGTTRDSFSDTPQGDVDGVESNRYLTTYDKVATESAMKTTIGTTDEFTERVTGKMGTKTNAKMLKEYRDILLNIDMMIINDLSNLFFGLW